jgi:hypothetical protein
MGWITKVKVTGIGNGLSSILGFIWVVVLVVVVMVMVVMAGWGWPNANRDEWFSQVVQSWSWWKTWYCGTVCQKYQFIGWKYYVHSWPNMAMGTSFLAGSSIIFFCFIVRYPTNYFIGFLRFSKKKPINFFLNFYQNSLFCFKIIFQIILSVFFKYI